MNRADRKFRYLILLEALLITVAFHVLLLLLFRYQPESAAGKRQDGGRTALLQIGNLSAAEQEALARWLSIHDPRHLARADTVYSPTADLKLRSRELPADLPLPELERPLPERKISLPRPFDPGSAPAGRAFDPPSPRPILLLPEESFPQFWLDGVLRPDLTVPPEVRQQAQSLGGKRNVFIFQRQPETGLLRFRIEQGSEHDNLDLRLIRVLLPQLSALLGGDGAHELEIRWQAEGAAR